MGFSDNYASAFVTMETSQVTVPSFAR